MKGLFIPEITAEMFRNGCLESIEALMAEGEIYDIDYQQPCELSDDEINAFVDSMKNVRPIIESQPCENCKVKKDAYIQGYDYGVKDWFKSKTQPCEDAISRELLLKHLENITMDTNPDHYNSKDKWYQANGFNLCKVGIEMYVKNLPSVTPQPKIDEIIKRIEETRDKDKLCEYPYNRCIDIVREVLGDD